MKVKVCKGCKIERDISWFYLRTDNGKRKHLCEICRAESRGQTSRRVKVDRINELFSKGLKECGKCKETKALDDFNYDKGTITGRASSCKVCRNTYANDNKHLPKKSKLKLTYGLEYEEWLNMKTSQNNKCLICYDDFSTDPRHVHTDHCHNTGKVRGILCRNCNLLLGHARDNISILERSIEYLKESYLEE